ncbi:MAG: hypothetical protein K2X29_07295, partial [Candidatus Obscuribacterales bacterium]|nr:hypothetical protein [Candidatus Obscuribacterales bacterium]
YAVQQLNQNPAGHNCASQAGASITWSVPAGILNDPNANVSVMVSTLNSPFGNPPPTSTLSDPLLPPYAYRMVTVTANYGGFVGGATKQLRSLLYPINTFAGGPNGNANGGGGGSTAAYNPTGKNSNNQVNPGGIWMPYGMFGVASIVYAGQAGFSSYNQADPRISADGGTLGKISQVYGGFGLSRSIVEGGSHYEFPDPQSYYTQQFNIPMQQYKANLATSAPWMTMSGNVYSNGYNTAYYPVTGPADSYSSAQGDTPAHNVYGLQNGLASGIPSGQPAPNNTLPVTGTWSGGLSQWNPGPLNADNVTYPQPTISPVPTAPTGTMNLGSINLTNGAQLIIDNTAPSPSGPIGTVKGTTVRIPPGSYNINSLSVTGNSSISVAPATQAAIQSTAQGSGTVVPPTQLYITGTNNGANVINIDNTSSINMTGMSNPNTANGFNTSGNMGIKDNNGQSMLDSTQLAISPAGSSSQVVESAGSAAQLQVYYPGSSFNSTTSTYNTQIVLSGNERMVLYAPNAGVMVGSPSVGSGGPSSLASSANFYGALAGGSVGVNSSYSSGGGAYVHYDANLRPKSVGGTSGGGSGGLNGNGSGTGLGNSGNQINPSNPAPLLFANTLGFNGYRAVSWQEAVSPNPGNPNLAGWTYP